MRKLATIRKIDTLQPIDDADTIECATVGGWKVVVKKGEFSQGSLAVYFEIDSWIPYELAPYLCKGKEPREFEGVKGERLRTVKLRGQLSQGLLMPCNQVLKDGEWHVGDDVTEQLGIKKWERPVREYTGSDNNQQPLKSFPSAIRKTDQERVQNIVQEIESARQAGIQFEITEKLEGSSMTCYLIDGKFGVCSRNCDLDETESDPFWQTARNYSIEDKMRSMSMGDFAIQGELIGPKIQGNIYKLEALEFHVFDVYNVQDASYLRPADRRQLIQKMGLKHVPVSCQTESIQNISANFDELLKFAEGKSVISKTGSCEREGIVFKQVDGDMTFKVISNKYLLKEK
ncbi:hypothetical protein MP228_010597 [Amoeboaphelidium protococcarum]|nr:hypothetical protein MP228_010597 [Amoeboaphelidium protococcarum]